MSIGSTEEPSAEEARALADRRLRQASEVLDRLAECRKEARGLRAENERLRVQLRALESRMGVPLPREPDKPAQLAEPAQVVSGLSGSAGLAGSQEEAT